MTRKVKRLLSDLNVDGSKTENVPPNIFFNLEKKNHNKKTIMDLGIEDDSTTSNDEKIMEAIESYYKTLSHVQPIHMNTI